MQDFIVHCRISPILSSQHLNITHRNDDTDWLEAPPEMNLQELIEDELLLAMPIALMHDHDCSKQSMQSGEKPNPFAMLKNLIK